MTIDLATLVFCKRRRGCERSADASLVQNKGANAEQRPRPELIPLTLELIPLTIMQEIPLRTSAGGLTGCVARPGTPTSS